MNDDRFYVFGGFLDSGLGAHGFLGYFASFKDAQEFLRMKKRAQGTQYDISWVHIANKDMEIVWETYKEDNTEDSKEYCFEEVDL